MKVKFFTQHLYDRTEIIITPAIGIIVRNDGWCIEIVWLMWSISFCFRRKGR